MIRVFGFRPRHGQLDMYRKCNGWLRHLGSHHQARWYRELCCMRPSPGSVLRVRPALVHWIAGSVLGALCHPAYKSTKQEQQCAPRPLTVRLRIPCVQSHSLVPAPVLLQRSWLVVTLLLDQYHTVRRMRLVKGGGCGATKQGRQGKARQKSTTDHGWELGRCRLKVYCTYEMRFHLQMHQYRGHLFGASRMPRGGTFASLCS